MLLRLLSCIAVRARFAFGSDQSAKRRRRARAANVGPGVRGSPVFHEAELVCQCGEAWIIQRLPHVREEEQRRSGISLCRKTSPDLECLVIGAEIREQSRNRLPLLILRKEEQHSDGLGLCLGASRGRRSIACQEAGSQLW